MEDCFMSKNNLMKKEFASKLKELCREKRLESITVKTLAEECGVNRGSFYYHFADIYDLIIWIFETEIAIPFEDALLSEGQVNREGVEKLLYSMYDSREFYCQAMRMDCQNGLADYVRSRGAKCWDALMRGYSGPALSMTEEAMQWLSRYTAQSVFGLLIDWAREGMAVPVPIMSTMAEATARGVFNAISLLLKNNSKPSLNPQIPHPALTPPTKARAV